MKNETEKERWACEDAAREGEKGRIHKLRFPPYGGNILHLTTLTDSMWHVLAVESPDILVWHIPTSHVIRMALGDWELYRLGFAEGVRKVELMVETMEDIWKAETKGQNHFGGPRDVLKHIMDQHNSTLDYATGNSSEVDGVSLSVAMRVVSLLPQGIQAATSASLTKAGLVELYWERKGACVSVRCRDESLLVFGNHNGNYREYVSGISLASFKERDTLPVALIQALWDHDFFMPAASLKGGRGRKDQDHVKINDPETGKA